MLSKRLPYDKTVVTEMRVQLADILSRTVRLKSSVATPILTDRAFNNGDVNISDAVPLHVVGVASVLILSSLQAFNVVLRNAGGEVQLTSNGLFVHTGAADEVFVTPISGEAFTRLQYIWS